LDLLPLVEAEGPWEKPLEGVAAAAARGGDEMTLTLMRTSSVKVTSNAMFSVLPGIKEARTYGGPVLGFGDRFQGLGRVCCDCKNRIARQHVENVFKQGQLECLHRGS